MTTVCKTEETGDFCAGANLTRSDPSNNEASVSTSVTSPEASEKKLFLLV